MPAPPTFADEVRQWKAYIKCALDHPPLPEAPTHVNAEDSVAEALRPLYRLVFELYATKPESEAFREPLDATAFPGTFSYYETITRPMSLRDVLDRLVAGRYTSTDAALADVDLIWANCEKYNGAASAFTAQAKKCADWLQRAYKAHADAEPAPLARVQRLIDRITQLDSLELLAKIQETVAADDPSLIVDDEVDFGNLKMRLLLKLEDVVARHARPGSAVSRGGRGSPLP